MAYSLRRAAVAVVACLPALVLALGGCSQAKDPWAPVPGGPLKVLVSFPPLYCFTKAVAGDDAAVLSLLAPTGPHEHRATADDSQIAAGADLFLVNGLELDDFVTTVANTSGNKKLKVVKVADKALPMKEGPRLKMNSKGHVHDDGTECTHGEWDPHVWLGVDQAIAMVNEIQKTLTEADPSHAANYEKRAKEYVAKLEQLRTDGVKLLAGKKNRKVIATHDALAYFCRCYGLELIDSIMPRPGIEAGTPKLAELETVCKTKDVRLIAIEPQYRRDAAEALRAALKRQGHDVTIVEVDPMETAPRADLTPDYYFTVMRRNLDNLAKAMQ